MVYSSDSLPALLYLLPIPWTNRELQETLDRHNEPWSQRPNPTFKALLLWLLLKKGLLSRMHKHQWLARVYNVGTERRGDGDGGKVDGLDDAMAGYTDGDGNEIGADCL
jgi:hypothetical protein